MSQAAGDHQREEKRGRSGGGKAAPGPLRRNLDAPAKEDWRGSAGIALVHLPGIPTNESYLRLQMAWPVGRESGVARFSVSFSPWRDLTPER